MRPQSACSRIIFISEGGFWEKTHLPRGACTYVLILTIQPFLNYASGTGKRVITFSYIENKTRAQQVSNHQAKLHNFIVVFQYLGLIASASCDHGSVFINTASLIRFILTNP